MRRPDASTARSRRARTADPAQVDQAARYHDQAGRRIPSSSDVMRRSGRGDATAAAPISGPRRMTFERRPARDRSRRRSDRRGAARSACRRAERPDLLVDASVACASVAATSTTSETLPRTGDRRPSSPRHAASRPRGAHAAGLAGHAARRRRRALHRRHSRDSRCRRCRRCGRRRSRVARRQGIAGGAVMTQLVAATARRARAPAGDSETAGASEHRSTLARALELHQAVQERPVTWPASRAGRRCSPCRRNARGRRAMSAQR